MSGSPWLAPPSGRNAQTFDSPTFTGVASFADGAVGTPSIARAAQPNTGIFFGASQVLFSINGATQVLIGGGIGLGSGAVFQWSSTAAATGSADVVLTRLSTGSLGLTSGRFSYKQGAAVASASQLTLGTDGNYFQITGTTGITLLDNTGWQGGSVVTLKFNASVSVSHNTAASGNFKPFLLAGAASFSATVNDTLTLRYDATDSAWYEMSRAVI